MLRVMHHVLNVDFGALEPLVGRHEPPDDDDEHGAAVAKTRPVHLTCAERGC